MKNQYKVLLIALIALAVMVLPVSATFSGWQAGTGCWTASDGNFRYVMFNLSGGYSFVPPTGITSFDYIELAGSGGGAGSYYSGGGGAGGLVQGQGLTISTPVTIIVGNGGAGGDGSGLNGTAGSDTKIVQGSSTNLTVVAAGGGYGSGYGQGNGGHGGSGGGAGANAGWLGGDGKGGQGSNGGASSNNGGGGGGSPASVGGSASDTSPYYGIGGRATQVAIKNYAFNITKGGDGGSTGRVPTNSANATGIQPASYDLTPGGGMAAGASGVDGKAGSGGMVILAYNQTIPTAAVTINQTQNIAPFAVSINMSTSTFSSGPSRYRAIITSSMNGTWGVNQTSAVWNTTLHGRNLWTANLSVMCYDLSGTNSTWVNQSLIFKGLPVTSSWTTDAINVSASYVTIYRGQSLTFTETSNMSSSQIGYQNYTFGSGAPGKLVAGGSSTTVGFNSTGYFPVRLNITGASPGAYQNVINLTDGYVRVLGLPSSSVDGFITPAFQTNTTGATSFPTVAYMVADDTFSTYNIVWGDGSTTSNLTYAQAVAGYPHNYTTNGNHTVIMWSMNALNSAYIEIPQCGETSTANFDPTPVTYVNKGAFGLVTVNVRNVSDVDQLVFSGQYNSSALYVQAITLNSSISGSGATLTTTNISVPNVWQANITLGTIKTLTDNQPVLDVSYNAVDITNGSQPIRFNSTVSLNSVYGSAILFDNGFTSLQQPFAALNQTQMFFTNQYFTKDFNFVNSVNYLPIQDVAVQGVYSGQVSGSFVTTTGTAQITSDYGTVLLSQVGAAGYFNASASVVFSNTSPYTVYMTPLSGATGTTVFYTPKQVRFQVVDAYYNPISDAQVVLNYENSTFQGATVDFLITAYGVSKAVAQNMQNAGWAMEGQTGSDGRVTFTVHGSLYYTVSVNVPSMSVYGYNQRVNPKGDEYILKVVNGGALSGETTNATSSNALALNGSQKWITNPNTTYIRYGLNYTDVSGLTTDVVFYWWNPVNGTVYKVQDMGNPGTHQVSSYFDKLSVRGERTSYGWNATRSV